MQKVTAKRIVHSLIIIAFAAIILLLSQVFGAPSAGAEAPQQAGSDGDVDGAAGSDGEVVFGEAVIPASVDLQNLPEVPKDAFDFEKASEAGLIDAGALGLYSDAVLEALQAESAAQGVDPSVEIYDPAAAKSPNDIESLIKVNSFKANDFSQTGGWRPPDPILAVGPGGMIAATNSAFDVFDFFGNSMINGPASFAAFWTSNCGTGSGVKLFDPVVEYDEKQGRYIIGIIGQDLSLENGNNGWACIAVSKTGDPAGSYWLYSIDGNPGAGTNYFFDYAHLGVGQDALYLSANMFLKAGANETFIRNHVMALEKYKMYAGAATTPTKVNVTGYFTLQPAKIHGVSGGGWPTNILEPHYYVSAAHGNGQKTLTVHQFNNPFGIPSVTVAGTVTVDTYNLPIEQPQLDGGNLDASSNRMLDVKYWAGKLYATHMIGCNLGGGTVNCVRWYIIDMSTGTPVLVRQGTIGSGTGSFGRIYPAIAANACGDVLLGYTGVGPNHVPSVYTIGLKKGAGGYTQTSEILQKAGEQAYGVTNQTPPYRWGDYTGMAIDPDGRTFYYLGEYARDMSGTNWSTWIGQYEWTECTGQPPTPTPTPLPTATATNTPVNTPTATNTPLPTATNTPIATTGPTATPKPGTMCSVYTSSDVPKVIPDNEATSISSVLNVPGAGKITDVNVVNLKGDHTWVQDLRFNLKSPQGTEVQVLNLATCGDALQNFDLNLDDSAASTAPCPPVGGGTYKPSNPLSAFNGQEQLGTWTLRIEDVFKDDGGSLDSWGLYICKDTTQPTATSTPTTPPNATATNTPTTTPTTMPTATPTKAPDKQDSTIFFNALPNPSQPGEPITLFAHLLPDSTQQTGSVTFLHDGAPVGNAPLKTLTDPVTNTQYRGAELKLNVDAEDLKPGVHSLQAYYPGDSKFNAATSPVYLHTVVGKQTPIVELRSSFNPASVGDKVVLTAHLLPDTDRPTGNVKFLDGATVIGTAALQIACGGDSGPVCKEATLEISTLTVGEHTLSAQYVGDSNFNGATSPPLKQTITSTSVVPPKPINLEVASGNKAMSLKWNVTNDTAVTKYRIRRSAGDNAYLETLTENWTSTEYFDSKDVVPGLTYCYLVEALRNDGSISVTSNKACGLFGSLDLYVPDAIGSPGETVIVPLNIRNADGLAIGASDIWMEFNSDVIEFVSISRTALTANYSWDSFVSDTANPPTKLLKIAYFNLQPDTLHGSGSLFWMEFKVKGTPGQSSPLNLKEFISGVGGGGSSIQDISDLLHDVPLSLTDGVFSVKAENAASFILGDVDGNGMVNEADADLALKMASGRLTPNQLQINAGDVNGNGSIGAADASMILYFVKHGQWPLPRGQNATAGANGAQATSVVSLGSGGAQPGQNASITLSANGLTQIAGGSFAVAYDTAVVESVVSVTPAGLTSNFQLEFTDSGSGLLEIALSNDAAVSGSGELLTIVFKLRSNAADGSSPLTLADAKLNDDLGRDFVTGFPNNSITRKSGAICTPSCGSGGNVFMPVVIGK